MVAVGSPGQKPLKDYSFIRGVNYGMMVDQAALEETSAMPSGSISTARESGLATRDTKGSQSYIDRLRSYIRTSHRLGFSTMPIFMERK